MSHRKIKFRKTLQNYTSTSINTYEHVIVSETENVLIPSIAAETTKLQQQKNTHMQESKSNQFVTISIMHNLQLLCEVVTSNSVNVLFQTKKRTNIYILLQSQSSYASRKARQKIELVCWTAMVT